MNFALLIDVAPDPVQVAGIGIVVAVIIFVIAAVVIVAGGLVIFLWYRKRSLRHREMIRPAAGPTPDAGQVNQPNQP
ncbi:MAG TPA: hypothetical protein VE961_19390 [Pyrinomonadaceae bacterium]|nr:hypothetical protein [Pyrinomonadaceae bacterium]